MAEILSFADKATPEAAEAKFGVSQRTIWRWRASLRDGKFPEVARLVSGLKADALERCKDLLADVYETGLTLLKNKMPTATYREILDTVTQTGELKAFRDSMSEDERSSTTGEGSAGQAGQGADPGTAGSSPKLRAV